MYVCTSGGIDKILIRPDRKSEQITESSKSSKEKEIKENQIVYKIIKIKNKSGKLKYVK